jgi:hypothetical protein
VTPPYLFSKLESRAVTQENPTGGVAVAAFSRRAGIAMQDWERAKPA